MNQYEITIITRENLKGEPAKKEIENLGGKVLNITELEERQFAYQVKKESSGYYTSIIFEIEPTKVLELNKKIGLNADVLRHLIITHKAAAITAPKPAAVAPVLPAVIPAKEIEEIREPKREEELITEEKVSAIKEEKKEEVKEKKAKPVKKAVKKEEEPKKVVEEPVTRSKETEEAIQKELSAEDRLKALDKKLDELLKE